MTRLWVIRAAAVGALVVGASGCGSSPSAPSTSGTPSTPSTSAPVGTLQLSSAAFADGAAMPAKYVCQARTGLGTDTNPPLTWANAPTGTAGFVLLMSTVANEAGGPTTKYNWVLYGIPPSATGIPEQNTVITAGNTGTTQVGTPGLTSDGPLYSYSPPCSAAGSGLRTYTFTIYAVSAAPVFSFNHTPGGGGDGANLAASLSGITLARSAIVGGYVF